MPRTTSRQKLAASLAQQTLQSTTDDQGNEENIAPPALASISNAQKPKKKSLKEQVVEKDARIASLEEELTHSQTIIQNLHAKRSEHIRSIATISGQYQTLLQRYNVLHITHKSTTTLKRKAETDHRDELSKKRKRIRRLENEREVMSDNHSMNLAVLSQSLADKNMNITHLENTTASLQSQISSLDEKLAAVTIRLNDKQKSLTVTRKLLYACLKRTARAKASLRDLQEAHKKVLVWNPTSHGIFTAEARKLARQLTRAGCAAEKIKFAIQCCAAAFGITVCRDISRRTVSRAIDEGGKYGEIQLGREILDTQALIESSDGTNHRGLTVESRHFTFLAPSYAPGVNNSDKSTWTYQTWFVEAAHALDHTAERQVQGTEEAVTRIADVFSRSPLAEREEKTMELDDFYRRKVGEMKDHAADGKKGFKISKERKKEVVQRDLGKKALDSTSVSADHVIEILLSITDKELEAAGKMSEAEVRSLSPVERSRLTQKVLEYKLGQEKFDTLPEDEQKNADTMVFGGCCCHKDLNVCKYGVEEMHSKAKAANLTPPVLLANKANAAVINLSSEQSDGDNPTVQNAIDSSSAGCIKFLELLGSLLRHKDGERGYQDRCVMFMKDQKSALFQLDEGGKQPDTSRIRYQSFSYAAAEVLIFHGIIYDLITEIIDAKAKSGQPNHVEYNVLKALDDPVTLSELSALALYGASVSWPYMATVHGNKESSVNLLDLTDIHRKLPDFCNHIAKNPHILLDPNTSPNELTINGHPFEDELLIATIRMLVPETTNLFFMISHMFSGAAKGWIRFTPEFHVGGTFDLLTPEQRKLLFIPATNDHNEGMLGSFRVHMRYHPSSTPETFSNQTRAERNNTEAFIEKHNDGALQKYVMQEVRKFGASSHRAKFRKAWMAHQRDKAQKALARRVKTATKKRNEQLRMSSIALELDVDTINSLTSGKLKDQLTIYRDTLKDPVLVAKLWKDMKTVPVRRAEVLAARLRELERWAETGTENSFSLDTLENQNAAAEPMIIDDFGYVQDGSEDAQWEDIPI
ncbi:hypothetical protein C8J56DRAFT_1110943 [Mycena floridula]|nr:hypothetical protein C8J56DRAFT_1110943 [Mycena floridula]